MNEFVPRRRTETPPPPGMPEFCVIWAPAILPCIAWSTVSASARASWAESTVATLVPSSPLVAVISTALLITLNIALYWLSFRVLTPVEVATRDLRPGAIVGGVGWTALQAVGGWLVARQLSHTSELYGTFGVVLGLLFFLYLASQIVVYSAEVNVVRARHLAPRSLSPPPLTPADEAVLADVARAEQRRPEEDVAVTFERPAR